MALPFSRLNLPEVCLIEMALHLNGTERNGRQICAWSPSPQQIPTSSSYIGAQFEISHKVGEKETLKQQLRCLKNNSFNSGRCALFNFAKTCLLARLQARKLSGRRQIFIAHKAAHFSVHNPLSFVEKRRLLCQSQWKISLSSRQRRLF